MKSKLKAGFKEASSDQSSDGSHSLKSANCAQKAQPQSKPGLLWSMSSIEEDNPFGNTIDSYEVARENRNIEQVLH
jgi:hypothetical protein